VPLVNLLCEHEPLQPGIVGLGAFDGVHHGHRELLGRVIERARQLSLPALVFTFDHSPRCLLSAGDFPGEITTPEEKFQLLLATGLDRVVFRPFDREFAMTSPEQFVEDIIVHKMQAREVFVGFNFGFGLHRRGNPAFLQELLARRGRGCHIISPVKIAGHVVSSSLIREAIAEGDFTIANQLLGREASFSGTVIHGDHRGRTMGFPTANLDLERTTKVLPPHGVYLCLVDSPVGTHPAVVNIGVRPTFDRRGTVLEAHLLNFSGDLYHHSIRVRFLKRLREEIQFTGIDTLVTRIQQDMAIARAFFGDPKAH
jgi:riboflavin kinase / FMN adenylyltransferase